MIDDFERCYRAVLSRDPRFDGWFVTAVTSTGVYCRPSCPATIPKRSSVRFFAAAGAAHDAGFRACRRCRPDAAPGSPEWDLRADLVGRAMRLIADGVVDREGVGGLATRLGYSARQVQRQLRAELGTGPLALARAQRARTARVLIEATALPFARVAFAAGFTSVRQFNATVADVFGMSPTQLRRRGGQPGASAPDGLTLRLAYREPGHADDTLERLGAHAIPRVEQAVGRTYRRSLALPHGDGVVDLTPAPGHVVCRLRLDDLRDLTSAVARCRRLLDADADPVAVGEHLSRDPRLAPDVASAPGRRVTGTVDGAETALRLVIGRGGGPGARRRLSRLVAAYGKPLTAPHGAVTTRFPDPGSVAGADLAALGLGARTRATVRELGERLAEGRLVLDPGADRAAVAAALRSVPGIGAWSAEMIALRALGDPDAFPGTDTDLCRAFGAPGRPVAARELSAAAQAWRPWRAYAATHLWARPATTGATRPHGPPAPDGRALHRSEAR